MTVSNPPTPSDSDEPKEDPGAPDGDTKTTKTTESETVSRSELNEAAKARDKAKERAKKAEAELQRIQAESNDRIAALEARLAEHDEERQRIEEESNLKKGDIEKLQKTWDAQREKLQKQLDDEKQARAKDVDEWRTKHDTVARKFYDNFVQRTLLEDLGRISRNPKSALLHLKADYEFEAVEDEETGEFLGVRAKGTDKSLEELHAEICAKYDLPFEMNERKPGAGTQPPGDPKGTEGVAKRPANWDRMSKEERQKWFAQNRNYKLG